jgi:hypothetical protein
VNDDDDAPDDDAKRGVDFGGSQMGDVRAGTMAGGNVYHGISPADLMPILIDRLADEAQWRRLELSAREIRQQDLDRQLAAIMRKIDEGMKSVELKFDVVATQLTSALNRFTIALIAIGFVLFLQTLVFIITLTTLIALLWPRLMTISRF